MMPRAFRRIRWGRAAVLVAGVAAVMGGVWGLVDGPRLALNRAVRGADAVASKEGAASGAAVGPTFAEGKAFIEENCTACHNSVDKTARLDLQTLAYDPEDRGNFALWVKVHDRVEKGEMPPKDMPRPDAKKAAAFVNGMSKMLIESETMAMAGEGRSTQRRMNRYEYENALRDLLHVPTAQIMNRLPQDGEAYRFNKSAEALDVSYVQMSRFMSSADYAMRMAMAGELEHPEVQKTKLYARDSQRNYLPRENGTLPDRLSFPVLDSHAQPDVRAGRLPNSSPETHEREAVGRVSSIFSDAGGFSWGFRAPMAGRYHLKVAGYTIWVSGGGMGRWNYPGQGAEKAPVYWMPLWHRPNADEVWEGRTNEPIGVYASSSGQVRPVGSCDLSPSPSVQELDIDMQANETLQTDPMRFFRTRVNGTDEQYVNPLAQRDGMPGVAFQWVEVEGPFLNEAPDTGYKILFGDLPLKRLEAGAPGGVPLDSNPALAAAPAAGAPGGPAAGGDGAPADAPAAAAPGGAGGRRGAAGRGAAAGRGGAAFGGRGGGRGGRGGGVRQVMVEVETQHPQEDAERLIRSFVARAYRRPPVEADVKRFIDLFTDQYGKGFGFARSMISAYTAVLSSPGFVFIQESPGKLDDYALATRLALFLWNSTPDEALRDLAARGELHKPEVLKAQTERLLNDVKSRRFVDAFTDYWLDLRKIDDTAPSSTLYNDYDMDDPLKLAALDESRMFFAELVKDNLPAKNVVDSDFTFLNEHLAKHYGIAGVEGSVIRKVKLPADSLRGGFMTQAAILKVTANGTTTSPVLRGHWITERILGLETPPPPPNAGAIEPDIRGAVTIRQQLEKHRADPSCALCHVKMDPPGFALEAFDVMGAYREKYRAASEEVKPVWGFGMNGQAFAWHWGLPADSAGALPDGRPFKDVRELKAMLVKDEDTIARNLVQQLSIFATGSPVRFMERPEIDKIMQDAKASDYGVRAMIHGIVQSELFQTK